MTSADHVDVIPCVIDNKPFSSSSSSSTSHYDVISPADRTSVLHRVASFPLTSIDELIASSKRGFDVWRDTSYVDRRKVFLKASELLAERSAQLVECEATETTAGAGFAGFDVGVLTTASLEETLCTMSTALRGEVAPSDASGKRMTVIREPYGGVLSIVPWNAPSTLCMRAIVNPLAAGNAVILKTSEFSPKTHAMIAQLFFDAGLPAGVLNVINVSTHDAPTLITRLIEQDFVRKVNFTGSTRVGRIIAQTCAVNLKPVVLELGGKAPVIVTDAADVDLAANNILFGGLMNQGQICMSTASVLVQRGVAEKLKHTLATLMAKHAGLLRAGAKPNAPMSPDVQDHRLRGLFTKASFERAKAVYDEAINAGAKPVAGKADFDDALAVVQPVFVEATPSMSLYREELFAPILGIYTFDTDAEAVNLANEPGAGLSASVFCKDETRAWNIARKIESGAIHLNGMTVHDEQSVPHGGFKTSGHGRFNGVDGIREYLYQKTITISPGIHYPFFAI